MILFLLVVIIPLAAGAALCVVNGVTTYLIARRTGRPAWMWTVLAITPGVNAVSSWYFYLTTVLRMADDLNALKAGNVFGEATSRPPV